MPSTRYGSRRTRPALGEVAVLGSPDRGVLRGRRVGWLERRELGGVERICWLIGSHRSRTNSASDGRSRRTAVANPQVGGAEDKRTALLRFRATLAGTMTS